jgi:hypothetical protein
MFLEKFFIPARIHEHQPHVLQKMAIGLMLVMFCLSLVTMNIHVMFWQSSKWLVGTVLSGAEMFAIHTPQSEGVAPREAIDTLSGSTATKALFVGETTPYIAHPQLQLTYLLLSIITATLLLLSVTVNSYPYRPRQVMYGLGLLVVMGGLFYIHSSLTGGILIA